MAKRSDSLFMEKVVNRFYGKTEVSRMQRLNLIHLSRDNIKDMMESEERFISSDEWASRLPQARLPFKEFLLMFEQPSDLNNASFCYFKMLDNDYCQLSFTTGSEELFKTQTSPLTRSVISLKPGEAFKTISLGVYRTKEQKGDMKTSMDNLEKLIIEREDYNKWCLETAGQIVFQLFAFLRFLETSDKFPVELKGIKPKPKKGQRQLAQKTRDPWNRTDLPTIRYLNEFPTPKVERNRAHLGGTHASPKPHPRSGHRRTLQAERYRNHELFQVKKALPVSPAWIGDDESIVDGVEYKVLRKEDILSKYS